MSMAEVESFFPERVISRGLWPPRSPDLTPPGFFLWGHPKGHAYMNKPHTLDELWEIQVVTPEVLAATFRNVQRRVQLCIDAQGGHFQHLLRQPHFIQVWHANVLYFCSFCKPTFSGATFEWDTITQSWPNSHPCAIWLTIHIFSTLVLSGIVPQILSFMRPHKQKSKGLKSSNLSIEEAADLVSQNHSMLCAFSGPRKSITLITRAVCYRMEKLQKMSHATASFSL
jgi:hypothetical protein